MKTNSQDYASDVVSVIIPVYNVALYLKEALDSVIEQTYQKLEIIIIDDGSTDGSETICNDYISDSRVRVIHQQNQGLSAARNAGLDLVTGEYLVFLDSDDAFCPGMIENLLRAAKRSNADIAVGRYATYRTESKMVIRHNEKKAPVLLPGLYDSKSAMRALANRKLNVAVWNKLYRTELWKDIRFPAGRYYEDRMIVWPLFERAKTIYISPDLLYLHRVRSGSITSSNNAKYRLDWLEAWTLFVNYVNVHTPEVFPEKLRKKVQQDRIIGMLHFYGKPQEVDSKEKELLEKIISETVLVNGNHYLIRCELWLLKKLLQNQ